MTRIQSPSSRLLLLLMVLGTLLLAVRSGDAQSIAEPGDSLRAAVATEAMLHNWRANKTRENRLRVTEMALAVDLHKRSVPPDEILSRVQDFRASIDPSSSQSGFVSATLTALGLGAGTGGMQRLGDALGWSNALTVGTRTAVGALGAYGAYALNSWYQGGGDDAAFQQLDVPLESKIREYVDLYHADPTFREAADSAITPRWHFSPNDDIDTILRRSPEFALHVDVQSLRDAVGNQATAVARLRDMAEDRLNAIQRDISDTATGLTTLATDVDGFINETRGRWAADRIRQRSALDVANAHATLGLAANLIGVHDPRLGRQVSAVSGAVFGVHAGVKAFETAAELGANMTLATTALTGNFVGAALNLVGVFRDTPSPEHMLMEQMQQLSRQVDQLRTEMHDRFDRVDARLVTMLDTVTVGFRDVQNRLDQLEGDLGIANARLLSLARGQRDIQGLIVTQAEILRERVESLIITIMGCAATSFPVPSDETDRDRHNCIAAFGALADSVYLSQAEIGRPDQLVDMHFKQFARLSDSVGTRIGVSDVVGPDAWAYVAMLLEEYLSERPDYAERFADEIAEEVGAKLARQRSDLRRYMAAVREDLRRFQGGSGQSAVDSVLQEARSHVARLRAAVSSIMDEYYAAEDLSGVRARVDADGTVTPAVRFEDDVPVWRPLSEFYAEPLQPRARLDYPGYPNNYPNQTEHPEWRWWYTGGEVPAWIEADSDAASGMSVPATCNTGPMIYAVEGQPGRNEERLRNIALDFLTTDDIAPARLGMGDIRFCYAFYEIDSGRNGDTLLYINYQTTLEYDFSSYGEGCSGERMTVRLPVYVHGYDPAFFNSHMSAVVRGWIISNRERKEDALKTRHLSDDCWSTYLERFEEKRRELSEYVRRGLEARDETARGSERTVSLGQAIQSWLSVAFDRARVRVGVVDDVVAGQVGLPDVAGMLQDDELYSWEIADLAEQSIDHVEEVLRSRGMQGAVEYGFGHRLLTDAEFAVLGDLEGGSIAGAGAVR